MTPQAGRDYGETLWAPGAATIARARITHYARWLTAERGAVLGDGYDELWRWSVADPGRFWASIWDYFDVLGQRGEHPLRRGGPMPDVTWFPGTTLNYARNALRHAQSHPGRTAVIYESETGRAGRLSYAELEQQVAGVAAGLR
ncbi:MAG: acetyl-coenzyme A synthetase N-terminal domain-containing protein, partial [Streptosporangiaceae bacterium]